MKFSMKRLGAFVLALVMVLGMLPVVNNSVNAAVESTTVLTGGPEGLELSVYMTGRSTPNKNEWVVTGGENISGNLIGYNNGNNKSYRDATATLTMTNKSGDTAILSFEYSATTIKQGKNDTLTDAVTVDGTVVAKGTDGKGEGTVTKTLENGESISIELYVGGPSNGANNSTISIEKLTFKPANASSVTTTFAAPDFGSYTVSYGEAASETLNAGDDALQLLNSSDVRYTMTVTPGEGNKFLGWYNVTTGEYMATSTTYSASFSKASTIKPIVVTNSSAVFKVANNYYADLDDAVTYATTKGETQITLVDSGTITKSDLGIPAGITLLIPMDEEYTPMGAEPGYTTDVVTPYAYKTLTLADGVELKVSGTVEVESKHTTLQGGKRNYGGRPSGAYGAVYMSPDSKITLNNGAILYAWGYVYGEGSVDALSGSKVYEIMQVTDFPGGSNASGFMDLSPDADDEGDYPYSGDGDFDNDYVKTFPFMQYYVQNIEVALTLYTGASEYVITTVTVGGSNSVSTPAIEFIGANGMFVPVSGSITKEYDPTTDRLIVDVDGEAKVNGMTIDMEGHEFGNAMAGFMNGATSFDTSQYILALNSNITININSGKTTIGQDMALLPGVEIYVDYGATLVIAAQTPVEDEWNNLTYDGSYGHNVYVYDMDNWGKYIFSNEYLVPVTYSPSTDSFRKPSDLKDVKIDINGTVICDGFVYSTVTLDEETYEVIGGGAEVISSGKTGKVIMNNGAGTEMSAFRTNGQAKEALVDIESVWLKNGNGTFLQTVDAEAGATFEYCATHDAWYQGTCQKCSPPTELTITWIVGTTDLTVDCEYNTVPVYPNGTPTKAQDGCTAYTFAGWSTSADGEVLATLPAATTEATYYAIFTEGTSHTSNEFNYESLGGTHRKTYKCCGADAGTEGCSGGTAWCKVYAVCQFCENSYGSLDASNHIGGGYYESEADNKHHFYYSCCGTYGKSDDCSDEDDDGDHLCDDCGASAITDCVSNAEHSCESGVCVECGEDMAAARDHDFDYNCDKNCNICGKEIWPDADHESVNGCDTDCKYCGEEIWPDAECVSDAEYSCEDGNCIYCGEPVVATDEHDWTDATCTDPKHCIWCGAEDGDALGHGTVEGWEYIENADGYHEVWCKDCWSYSYTDDHDYGDDHECDCGAMEPYTVTFMNGDTVFEKGTFYHNSPLNIYGMNIPDAPTGYGWDGWRDADGEKLVLGMTVTSDLTFYATWKLNTYKLNVYVGATDEYVTLDATYGAKIEDVIAQAVADGKLPAIGDKIRTQNEYFNGEYIYTFYDYQNADEEWIAIDETTTMPAQDFEIMLNSVLVGWYMSDVDDDGVIDGAEYYDNKLGYLQGWQYIEEDYDGVEGGAWYYFGIQVVEENTYCFRAEGVTRVPYPETAINGITYGPNAEDVAYEGDSFVDKDTALFVFGEDGKFDQSTGAVRDSEYNVIHYAINGQLPWHLGFVQVGSHVYYFVGENVKATGDVYVSRAYNVSGFVSGGVYTFGADGNMLRYNGITEVDGVLRYYDNAQLMLGNGLTQVDENYIYVNSNGELVVDAEYYVGANDFGIAKGIYSFDENGYIVIPEADPVKNGFYFEDGSWYYYVEGVKDYCAGLICTTSIMWYETADAEGVENQGWVYVKSDGSLVCDAIYYVTNVNGNDSIASGDKCVFGADCLLQNAQNGIIDGYYYENNQIAYGAGVVVIGGKYYYVKSNGQIVVDQDYWTTNVGNSGVVAKLYAFDENGVFVPEFTADAKNGIVDGYYYVDGHIAYCAGLIEIEPGKYIYVKSNGELATGEYWTTNHKGVLKEGLYDFGEDGILVIE